MKTKNKTILVFILVFTGITLCYSQGWADSELVLQTKTIFTCNNQGPAANKTVEVQVSYKISGGNPRPDEVTAKDKTDPSNILEAIVVNQPYLFMRGENNEVRVGKVRKTGPRNIGSIISTKNNYPVFVWGNKAWFFYEK